MAIRDITAAALKEAEDSVKTFGSFKLKEPENARVNKNNPLQKFWTEGGRVLSAKHYEAIGKKSGLTHDVFEIKLEITAEGSGENIGQKFTVFPRISFDATEDKAPGDVTMSRRSRALLSQFIEANGIELPTDGEGRRFLSADILNQVFTPTGADSPVIGTLLMFEVKQTAPEDPKAPDARWQTDVQTFMEA